MRVAESQAEEEALVGQAAEGEEIVDALAEDEVGGELQAAAAMEVAEEVNRPANPYPNAANAIEAIAQDLILRLFFFVN